MTHKNADKELGWLIRLVDIFSTIPIMLCLFGITLFGRFLYSNFEIGKSFPSKFTIVQQQELSFSLCLLFCGCVLIPLVGITYNIGKNRTSFFSKQSIELGGDSRYKPLSFVGYVFILTLIAGYELRSTQGSVQNNLVILLGVLTAVNVISFLGIEWYRKKLVA